jgi:hypothetical protein
MATISTISYKMSGFYNDNELDSRPAPSTASEAPPPSAAPAHPATPGLSRRLGAGLKERVQSSSGLKDYRQAFASLRLKPYDTRTLRQRIGEFSSYMMKGGAKSAIAGMSLIVAGAVIGGSISNYQWPETEFFGQLHLAARHLATAALELAKCVLRLGRSLGEAVANGFPAVLKVILNNPMVSFKIAGVGTIAYLTYRQLSLVGQEESYTRKAYHVALAMIGVGAMVGLSIV